MSMFLVRTVSEQEYKKLISAAEVSVPIEQTPLWARYQATIQDRKPWRFLAVYNKTRPIAVLSLIRYSTHGYHFLRAAHGPVYLDQNKQASASTESNLADALLAYTRSEASDAVFIRMASRCDLRQSRPVLSSIPYDQTVVIDTTGSSDDILSRMKRRGRRDVRKSLRECPAVCADETEQASRDFSDYYAVLEDTGQRDGFEPAPMSDYSTMISALGPNHCRVFAARLDGKVIAWSLVTINGNRAVRYYAAMMSQTRKMHVTDRLLFEECCLLSRRGITRYDLMGIGSDFSPSLKGLNEFKTKFTTETTAVSPERDFPIHKIAFSILSGLQKLRGRRGKD